MVYVIVLKAMLIHSVCVVVAEADVKVMESFGLTVILPAILESGEHPPVVVKV